MAGMTLGPALLALALPLTLAAGLAGCGGDDDNTAHPDTVAATPDAPAGPTWTSFASGFTTSYCAECHGAGDPLRDLTVLAMVRAEQDKIRCGVSAVALDGCAIPAAQFPIGDGPFPSADERADLVLWIDEGAPE